MEKSQNKKISLVAIFLIISIIIIVLMGIFLFRFYNEKIEEAKKATELQTQVNSLTNIVSELQEKMKNASEVINSDSQDTTKDNNTSTTDNNASNNNIAFTDEQVKNAISDYLELSGYAQCDLILDRLTEIGKISYDHSKDDVKKNGDMITTVKFSDYKKAMLNYVSENEFNRNWTTALFFDESVDGYLIKIQGGGVLRKYTVDELTKINDKTYLANNTRYLAKVTVAVDGVDEDKGTQSYKFTISTYNNKCVIDSIEDFIEVSE